MLGLAHCTRNMLRRFAENISASKDWCTYWEIDRWNRPCSADYRDDNHFWYNLPANFDVLDCCWRQYRWTGDRTYLDDASLRYFYARSVDEFVSRWDRDRDGLVDHQPEYGTRGIASYNEEIDHPLVAGDQIAAQYAGYLAYAGLCEEDGNLAVAGQSRARAANLKAAYSANWWNEATHRFNSFMLQDRTFCPDYHGSTNFMPLYFGLSDDSRKAALAVDDVIRNGRRNVEERSYLPEILYRYGRAEDAYAELAAQIDPAYGRREYPEVAYAVIGSIAAGMLGIDPDAREHVVATLPRLTEQIAWAELSRVPVFANRLTIRHDGARESTLTNYDGPPLFWKATFPGRLEELLVDGAPWHALPGTGIDGRDQSSVIVRIGRGETHHVSVTMTQRS